MSAPWSALLLCALSGTGAVAAGPTFKVVPDTLRADSTGMWHADIRVGNTNGQLGLYPDSLSYAFQNDDPDRDDRPRSGRMRLDALARMLPPLSAGEETAIAYGGPADFEHGTLMFRLSAHDAAKHDYTLESRVIVAGSDLGDSHPAIVLDAQGQHTDMVILPAPADHQPAPAILVVPPAGTSARSLMRWGSQLASRGYMIGIVSLPGAGRSAAPADAWGPASLAVVRAAVARLARESGVDPARIVVWGQREGANAALLAAAGEAGPVAGLIAEDADYDPWAAFRAMPEAGRRAFVAQAGSDSAAWRARSPLAAAQRIAAPILVLRTGEAKPDELTSAQAFIAKRAEKQLYVESRWSEPGKPPMRRQEATRIALGFADRRAAKSP